MISGLAIAGLKDNEIWGLIFEKLSKFHVNKFYFFQKRILHISLKYIQLKQLCSQETFNKILPKISLLSHFCIADQLSLSSTHIRDPYYTDNKVTIDCCSEKDITEFPLIFKDIKKVNNQYTTGNPYEELIKDALIKNLEVILKKYQVEFELKPDRICQYRYDLIVKLYENGEYVDKFGIEISGVYYYFNSGRLIGKKKIKYEI